MKKFAKINDALFTALDKNESANVLGGLLAYTRKSTSCSGTNGQTDGGGADCWDDCSDLQPDQD